MSASAVETGSRSPQPNMAEVTTPKHPASGRTFRVKVQRQATPDAPARTETFAIPYRPNMNITSVLGEIALNPVTADGQQSTAIAYDANCLEEICGSCAMRINGKAMMACSALVDKLLGDDNTITLAPQLDQRGA